MLLRMLSFIYNSIYLVICLNYNLFSFIRIVLPYGLDVGLVSVSAYLATKLKKPNPCNVVNIFGPVPGSKESEEHPERIVKCIAHRGAGLDAPENTLEAFKYCVEHECKFIELDVRSSKDGKLVLLHDPGLQRLTGSEITNIHIMDWDMIKNYDIGQTHPNRKIFKEVFLCLLDDALDYLLANNVRIIIDVKGQDKEVVNGIIDTYAKRPILYETAAVTCFNPFTLYQIRKRDPKIVGALSYRPYCFSAHDYDAENGPTNFRSGIAAMAGLGKMADALHALVWRWTARWCAVSAVLLHKDIVSPFEVAYWRNLNIRCIGWCVNRPLEKLYWRGVLKTPYLANTLLGEPDTDKKVEKKPSYQRRDTLVDDLTETEHM